MHPTRTARTPARSRYPFTAAAAVFLSASPGSRAASRYWVNNTAPFGNANWSLAANWSATSGGTGGATVPAAADTAYINFNDTKNQTTLNPTLDITTTIAALNIGSTSAGTPVLFQNTNTTLTVTGPELIGYQANGRGAYNQSAGANTATGGITLGYETNSRGTYTLAGTASLLTSAASYVGYAGAGTFNQTGGTFTANANLSLGYLAGSSGTYNLQAGSLALPFSTLGVGGNATNTGSVTGAFVQSGGSANVSTLAVGSNGGGTGSYSLASSATLLTGTLYVGKNDSTTAAGTSSGTFSQSGGSVTAVSLFIGDARPGGATTGLYSLGPDASLVVTGTAYVGYNANAFAATAAAGTFLQTGGAVSAQDLTIGYSSGGTAGGALGLYSLSAGSLAVADTTIVGNSVDPDTFSQTGGTHTNAALTVNANATYLLAGSSPTLTTTSFSNVYGTLSHTAGTYSVGTPGSAILTGMALSGTYSLSGSGALVDTGLLFVSAGAHYAQSAGTATVGSPTNPARVILGLDNEGLGATATYSLSGTASSEVYGPFELGGTDLVAGVTGGPGALSITGGTLTVHGPIRLFPPTLGGYNSIHIDGGSLSITSFIGTAAVIDVAHGTLSLSSPDPVTLGSSAALAITLGPGGNISAASFLLTAGDPIVLNGGTLNYTSSLTLAGATLTTASLLNNSALLSGTGTINGAGALANSGSLSIPAGNLTLATTGPNSSAGLLSLAPGAQLALTGSPLSNTGLLTLSPGSRVTGTAVLSNQPGGVIQGAGTISSPLTNAAGATLLLTTGTLNLTQPLTNAGTIQLAGPASTLAGASLTNTGTLRGDGSVTNPLTNASTGQIRADAGQSLALTNMSSPNAGTLNLQGGSLTFSQPLTNAGTITGHGGSLTAPSLSNTGSILLTGGATDFHAPLTSATGSSITVTTGAGATFFNPVTLNPGSQFRVGPNSTAVFLAPVTGQGQFTGSGTKDFESGASAPSSLDTAGLGSTTVESPASLTTSYLNESSLTLFGPLALTPSSPASRLNSLSITGPAASLDLANNPLILDFPDAATVAATLPQIRLYLHNAQLFSSTANSDPQHRLAIAYADNSLLNVTTWAGLPVDSTSLLTKLTYLGDANLDGRIDADDYALLDRSHAKSTPDAHWTDGDFNYDGQITPADYLLIDRAFASQNGTPSPEFLATRESEFGASYVQSLLTSIPEPSLLTACGLALPLLPRRRKPR